MAIDRHELRAIAAVAAAGAVLVAVAVLAPRLKSPKAHAFARTEAMIPMRDGAKLETSIYRPNGRREPLPILLTRTPYGVPREDDALDNASWFPKGMRDDGYILVWQNLRGRFRSEGQFVLQRAPHDPSDPKGVDESTDAYDTIDWLVKNVPNNNGRVCAWGTSYGGFTANAALLDPHPALKCASPRASMGDQFKNDDLHHNGALRLQPAFEAVAFMEGAKDKNDFFDFETYDAYDWYLRLGALSHVDERYFHGTKPTWEALVAHPSHDAFWRSIAPATYLKHTTVPTMHVAGWWDQEDFVGPVDIYASLEKTDDAKVNHLVIGPWNHGGWNGTSGRKLGSIDFGAEITKDFKDREQRAWFAHWLHDAKAPELAEATIFETGTNRWRTFDAWPPKSGVVPRRLYLREHRAASFEPPPAAEGADAYVSDPASPVPYRPRPIGGGGWDEWLVQDQRFADGRPDVLTWVTPPLENDVAIAGDIVAELFASTSGTDADWVVKLIDVLPDEKPQADAGPDAERLRGFELIIASEILRGRFRNSLEKPEPVPANDVVRYAIDLHARSHVFSKGHRIMVHVQSSWFPVYDRNPQKYVDNIFLAKDEDYVAATHRVHRSAAHPSAIVLPVLEGR